MGLNKVKLRRGLAGLVAGLIAAIALLVIALPVMMQYQQHITKSYHIKEYATMLEKQKEIEEKGLASCFNQDEGVLSINNTLGTPVRIVMVYATDGSQSQKYFNASGYVIKPGVNRIPLSKFGITIPPENIKTIKLVTSRGTIIQPPYCREIVKIVTYEQVIEYIIKKLRTYPISIYLSENQTSGIATSYYGKILTHGAILYYRNPSSQVYLVNGTTVSDIYDLQFEDVLINLFLKTWVCDFELDSDGVLYDYYYMHMISHYSLVDIGNFAIKRCEAGDYVAYVIEVYTPGDLEISDDTQGCYCVGEYCGTCKTFSLPDLTKIINNKAEFKIIVLAINYNIKNIDPDKGNSTSYDPLEYVIVNSGYNELIVGFEGEEAKETINYNAYIFISKNRISLSGTVEDIINTLASRADIRVNIIGDCAEAYYKSEVDTLPTLHRSYVKITCTVGIFCGDPVDIMHDQKTVIIPRRILSEVGIEPGDKIYVYVVSWYQKNGKKYLDYSEEPTVYTFAPIKTVVDEFYNKYIGG